MDGVYTTLRRIARGYLRKERSDHTLQPTALVNEVYLKLFGRSEVQFVDRAHFFAVVSQAMRRILVDHARMRAAARREGQSMRNIRECTKSTDRSIGRPFHRSWSRRCLHWRRPRDSMPKCARWPTVRGRHRSC